MGNEGSLPLVSVLDLDVVAICDKCTSRSLRNACATWAFYLQSMNVCFASAICALHSLSMLSVFALLHSVLSVSLLSTQSASILDKDDESPRNSGVANMDGSGGGSTVFDDETLDWSGCIQIVRPVGQDTVWSAMDNILYSTPVTLPGTFPSASASFISFLPTCPLNLS